jgi:multiple RNA-binding domain-containing protein 1
LDKLTKESKGYAFILYVIPENAVRAFDEMDKKIFQGRIIEIVAAKEKVKIAEEYESVSNNFKALRQKKQQETAGNEFNWNSLFMNVYYS